jgi:DNA (cytosine-5)-methyltransferase 1
MKKLGIKQQQILLNDSIQKKIPLANMLELNGYSYESLVYQDESLENSLHLAPFVPVNERPAVSKNVPCVSFFSGAGGLDIGFECAGFKTLVDIEINQMFCDTLRTNGAKCVIGPPYSTGDVKSWDKIIEQLTALGIPRKFPGVFHGGPPCQSFSIAANQRFSKDGENFKRTGFQHEKLGNLLFCYINIIVHFSPEVFLIENVDGLLSIDKGEQVKRACSILEAAGYNVTQPRVVNAADYGVPQKRLRTFIVGSRIGKFVFPEAEKEKVPAGSVFLRSLDGIQNHVTRNHNAESVKRYMMLEYGKRDHLGRVDRLDPNRPSKTIIAGGTGGGGRSHLHPFIPRTMSVRECARLQTFPDSYVFTGPVARQFTQVGNAVPPVLGYVMACAIHNSIYAVIPKISIEKPSRDFQLDEDAAHIYKSMPVQLTMFESGELHLVKRSPITLLGTYRKVCRDWILDNNFYNYPVTDVELKQHRELRSVSRLVLMRKTDEPLYFAVKSHSLVTKASLKKLGYKTNSKHPVGTKYILYKLRKLDEPIPSFDKGTPRIVGKGVSE